MSDRPAAQGGAIQHAPLHAPHRMVLGLSLLSDESGWLQVDADRGADLREKRRLLQAQRGQVFAELPGSRPAQEEIRGAIVGALLAHHPGALLREGRQVEIPALDERLDLAGPLPPLELASRLVQEDLCLMERDAEVWRLTAASVCFPTRWDLPSKVGQSLREIHDPVPGYREGLADPTDRFFDGFRPGRIAARANWSLVDSPDLFQPLHGNRSREPVTRADVAERVWLRVERQTLRRFPETGAILFTIRIHRDRLGGLAAEPARAGLLAEDLRTLPEELARYKSIPDLREPVLAYLDEVAAR
ncbi:MAG: DUF3445 domain-containing protein [Deltaproteobacteria bacterium]|nr:DUF3445 domain-containing protein [Deltaproteobacteria bacterium]MBW2445825.1 DUF3445 domain-containing protein [Deltaproteobacteria bacterium]